MTPADPYLTVARDELKEESATKVWWAARAQRVLHATEAHDILEHFGVSLRSSGNVGKGESIPCPFHGDSRPSAKVQPANEKGPSHLWCYVCRKNWNAIELWMEFTGIKWGAAIAALEKHLSLPPARPPQTRGSVFVGAGEVERVSAELEVAERMFRNRRNTIPLDRYARVSVVLDKLWATVKSNPQKVSSSLRELIRKVCRENLFFLLGKKGTVGST